MIFRRLPTTAVTPFTLIWAFIGLLLTIGGTFLQPALGVPSWSGGMLSLGPVDLTSSAQIAAVLFTACVGGAEAGAIAQIAYLVLGLFQVPVFANGGGLDYLSQPGFGFLLGFAPAAWVTGRFAHRYALSLELLGLSCLAGWLVLQSTGFAWLTLRSVGAWARGGDLSWMQLVWQYCLWPLPGQLALLCATALLAYGVRRLLFL